ncbi:MAG: DUF3987 domain-containing protein [Planctomycetia bacterium]|nr:DUF3987 domain-containing protein [Planctomycetia bacterium]
MTTPRVPFPVDALPEPVADLVAEGAEAIGCDASYLALPKLVAVASAIGNSRTIFLSDTWQEPAVIWAASVGDSGTLKSPAHERALAPLRRRQADAFAVHDAAMQVHEGLLQVFEANRKAWQAKGRKAGEPPPETPQRPVCVRYLVSDTTIEALAQRLSENPRGLLIEADELAGWLRSFDKYRAGKGGDCAAWLSMHRAGAVTVDRKTGERPQLYIPRAAVSVCGGIQPGILRACIGREHAEDGLLARLLLSYPPRRQKQWRDATIHPATLVAIDSLFGRLLELNANTDKHGAWQPVALPLTPEAKRLWIVFYNEHAAELADLSGDLAACWSKLEGYAARLALICQLIHGPESEAIDEDAMQSGIALARWFGAEARRVYGLLAEDDDDRDRRQLVEWIEGHGGNVTAHELAHGPRAYRGNPTAAEAALAALVKAGYGKWETRPAGAGGGRPTRAFVLGTCGGTGTTTPESPESNGSSSTSASRNGHDPEAINRLLAGESDDDGMEF